MLVTPWGSVLVWSGAADKSGSVVLPLDSEVDEVDCGVVPFVLGSSIESGEKEDGEDCCVGGVTVESPYSAAASSLIHLTAKPSHFL